MHVRATEGDVLRVRASLLTNLRFVRNDLYATEGGLSLITKRCGITKISVLSFYKIVIIFIQVTTKFLEIVAAIL